jgi:hypothetical protein
MHLKKLASAQVMQTMGQMFDLMASTTSHVLDFDVGVSSQLTR